MSKLENNLEAITVRMIERARGMDAQTSKSYREQCADAWEAMAAALADVKAKERPDAFKLEVARQEKRFKEELNEAPGIVRLIGIHWLIQLVTAEKRKDIDIGKVTPWSWREFVVFVEQDSKDADTYLTAPYVWKEEPTDKNAKEEGSAKEEALELLAEVSAGKMSTRDIMEAKVAILNKWLPGRPARKAKKGAVAPGGDPAKKGVNLVVRQLKKGLASKGAIRRAAFVKLAEEKAVGTTAVIGILQGMDTAGELGLADIQRIGEFLKGIAVRLQNEAGADDDEQEEQEEQEAPAPRKSRKATAAA